MAKTGLLRPITTDEIQTSDLISSNRKVFRLNILLNDQSIVRKRTVYDFITLIAEVTGFIDIFMISV